ncbi:hypothetical protein [Roseibium sp.]|uniref:hypothetical protein n=1 Tax=Roseibium sp. TaxID=1936156 RepID=UPI003A971BB3
MTYHSDTSKTVTTGFGAGWFMAGALVVTLIAGGFLYYQGYFTQDEEISIELNLPNMDTKKITTPIPGNTDG